MKNNWTKRLRQMHRARVKRAGIGLPFWEQIPWLMWALFSVAVTMDCANIREEFSYYLRMDKDFLLIFSLGYAVFVNAYPIVEANLVAAPADTQMSKWKTILVRVLPIIFFAAVALLFVLRMASYDMMYKTELDQKIYPTVTKQMYIARLIMLAVLGLEPVITSVVLFATGIHYNRAQSEHLARIRNRNELEQLRLENIAEPKPISIEDTETAKTDTEPLPKTGTDDNVIGLSRGRYRGEP